MNEPLIERTADRDGTIRRRFVGPGPEGGIRRAPSGTAVRPALRASALAPAAWLAALASAAMWFVSQGPS